MIGREYILSRAGVQNALNFAGDRVLEAKLEEVRRQFLTRTAEDYRDETTAQARLTTGIQRLSNEARNRRPPRLQSRSPAPPVDLPQGGEAGGAIL